LWQIVLQPTKDLSNKCYKLQCNGEGPTQFCEWTFNHQIFDFDTHLIQIQTYYW
jgi:hypothetical protein